MNKIIQHKKGFTVIELIVVIAIITIVATIVMTNITQYNNTGKDTAIKGNMSSVLTNSTDYLNKYGNYISFCSNATVQAALAAADKAYDGNATPNEVTDCNAVTAVFAACAQLKSADAYFCVDSSGTKKTVSTRSTCVTAWALTTCP